MLILFLSVEVKDISLTDYIQVRHPVWVPHTAGRYAKKRFKKAQMPIVERLVDSCVFLLFGGFSRFTKSFTQYDDEGAQQRQKTDGRAHRRSRI
jgi:hypothetical protein